MGIERDLYLSKDCTLIEALKQTSIKVPDYLLKSIEEENKEDEEEY